VVFLVDGMDLTRTEQMLRAGELPNIQRVFVEGGVRVRVAVTSLPSITYCNCTSVITGLYPGHHGIMGNFWFDRQTLQTHYYMTYGTYRLSNQDFTAPTLFEMLDDHFTVSIQAHTRRGADVIIDNHAAFGFYWGLARALHSGTYYVKADRHIAGRFDDVPRLARKHARWPSVVFTYYPGTDDTAHTYGSDSEIYRVALRDIDATVGRVAARIDELGLRDSTYLVLVTDHSHVPIGACHKIDIPKWLAARRGLKVRVKGLTGGPQQRLAALRGYDALGGLDADRIVRLYLPRDGDWSQDPTAEAIDAFIHADPPLMSAPGVGWIMARDSADSIRVFTADAEARVERRYAPGKGGRAGEGEPGSGGHAPLRSMNEYRLINIRGDALNYLRYPELAAYVHAGWHSSRDWLAHTVRTDCPDFVAQAVEVFDSEHTGDVVLLAAGDWSFEVRQEGGHGSILAHDMKIPLFFAGADLPRGAEIGPARIVDVTPTIIGLLGEADRLRQYNLDGIDLSEQLRAAHALSDLPSDGSESILISDAVD
jgi:hypothetical protein